MTIHKTLAPLALLTLVLALPAPSNPPARSVGVPPVPTAVPTSQVLRLVAAAARITTLPKDLTPTLKDAARDGGELLASTQKGCVQLASEQVVSVPACVWGDHAGSHTLVLLGDSHARMWLPAFDAIGQRLHWKVVLLAKSNCPPPYTDFYNWPTRSAYPACDRWHSYTIGRINHTNPDLVVMSGSDEHAVNGQKKPVTRAVWAAALLKTLHMITSPKTTKVILGPTPEPGHYPTSTMSPVECLAAHEDDVQACSSRRATMLPYLYADTDRAVAKQAGVQYIDVFPWFCSAVCTAVIGNMVVYGWDWHITATYATYLSGALQAALQPAMGGKRF
jgi:hypothetical protein